MLALDGGRTDREPTRRHGMPRRALRRRAGRGAARGRRGAGVRRARDPRCQAAGADLPSFDLLNLPRPPAAAPWAYVKVAEGCDRACGFCAIPSFRGPQRSRSVDVILREVDELGAVEIVLVAQDLAAFGRDQGRGGAARSSRWWTRSPRGSPGSGCCTCTRATSPMGWSTPSAGPGCRTSTSPSSTCHARSCGGCGGGATATGSSPASTTSGRAEPEAAFRSNFIVGYPGETEADHDALLRFVEAADLDWCGFFSFSREEGTYAAGLDGAVPDGPRRRAPGRAPGAPGRDHRDGNVTFRWANGSKGSWTSPVPPARRGRRPRSTG